ncbi:MAG: hypothetical protein V7609_1732 [Verrucomicrobiota bacterium]
MPLFRHSAGFGKRIEFWIIGQMMKEGLDVYVPLVDDMGIDAVVRRTDGSFIEVQIKARSKDIGMEGAALFSALKHELRSNYWFVFYSEWLQTMWITSSQEFLAESIQNKTGKNIGKRAIWFNGMRRNKGTKTREPYPKERYRKYLSLDFGRLVNPDSEDDETSLG